MKLRQIIILIAALVFLGASFALSGRLSQKKETTKSAPKITNALNDLKQVKTREVKNTTQATQVEVYGKLVPFEKLDIFSEMGGMLRNTSKPFKKGVYFKKGDVLFEIDDQEQRLNLMAARSALQTAITQMMPDLKIDYPASFSNWDSYLKNFNEKQSLRPFPVAVNAQEKNFVAAKNIYNQYYNIRSQEERLSKYIVYAPISGIITEAFVLPGTLIRPQQKLGSIMNTGSYELEAPIPVNELDFIKTGARVKLSSEDISGSWNGQVTRVSKTIDPSTQAATVYIAVSGKKLRENLYLRGNIAARSISNVTKIPREILIEGDKIYVVQDSVLQLKNIRIEKMLEQEVLVSGLPDGAKILERNYPGLYDGLKVEIE